MLRLKKPVKLYEWGEGTNTLNQVWTESGEGKILRAKTRAGVTLLTVQIGGNGFRKLNQKDDSIKVAQVGEGMTGCSTAWGEVTMGRVKNVEPDGHTVIIEIKTALKVSN